MNGMQEEINVCLEEIDQQKFEIDQLVREANELRGNVADMKKNMGFDDELFDDLDEFDKKVSLCFGGGKRKLGHDKKKLLWTRGGDCAVVTSCVVSLKNPEIYLIFSNSFKVFEFSFSCDIILRLLPSKLPYVLITNFPCHHLTASFIAVYRFRNDFHTSRDKKSQVKEENCTRTGACLFFF